MRRSKIHVGSWLVGSVVLTALWVAREWQANGAFAHFGHDSGRGDWNPTLLALVVGVWGLFVGIEALRLNLGRLRFHVAAWALGMIVLTPLWALIEWQDNGGFARWSANGRPGDWEPWILYVGGVWALAIGLLALQGRLGRRRVTTRR